MRASVEWESEEAEKVLLAIRASNPGGNIPPRKRSGS
jgi:hypothetical protein